MTHPIDPENMVILMEALQDMIDAVTEEPHLYILMIGKVSDIRSGEGQVSVLTKTHPEVVVKILRAMLKGIERGDAEIAGLHQ